MTEKKYNYLYKITNKTNGKFYYGIHSTDNLNDGYMGSGHRLRMAYKKEGIQNFEKEILKFFETRKEVSDYESEVVSEVLLKNPDCYNIKTGGEYWNTIGSILVRDKDGKLLRVKCNDEELESGEYVPCSKDMVIAKEKGESNFKLMDREEFYKNRNLYQATTDGYLTVTDTKGNYYKVHKNDERITNGVLKPIWCGRKHSEETKNKMRQTHQNNAHQQGKKNSQYGTCWLTNGIKNIKIDKSEVIKYLNDGWIKGRVGQGPKLKYDISYNELKSSIDEGLTRREMALKYNVSLSTLCRMLKRHNLKTKHSNKK